MTNLNNFWQVNKTIISFSIMGLILLFVGLNQTWTLALGIINLSLISAVMAMGVNIQWGYAGLFNVGILGFAALGGVSVVLISQQPVAAAVEVGGLKMLIALFIFLSSEQDKADWIKVHTVESKYFYFLI